MSKLHKSVDRLSVLDGAIVAVGWSSGEGNPEILVGGEPALDQRVVRFHRHDLNSILGNSNMGGFRAVAVMPSSPSNNADICLSFPDGQTARLMIDTPDERYLGILNRFHEAVAAKADASMIEIGSRARSGNSYRDRFPTLERYVGMDIAAGPNVDIVADAHTLSKSITERFDFAFSVSVWEHLIMPWVASFELNKILKPGGMAYIQSHASWPLHELPWDFFRFSSEAWRGLFNPFTGFETIDAGYGLEATLVPIEAKGGPLQGIDTQRTFLVSACLVRKVSEPRVDWTLDPSSIYDLHYSH